MRGRLEKRVDVGDFTDFAVPHDCHAITHLADHRQIVADEQHRQAKFLLQIFEQVQDRGLNRYVQSGRWFVADQDARA